MGHAGLGIEQNLMKKIQHAVDPRDFSGPWPIDMPAPGPVEGVGMPKDDIGIIGVQLSKDCRKMAAQGIAGNIKSSPNWQPAARREFEIIVLHRSQLPKRKAVCPYLSIGRKRQRRGKHPVSLVVTALTLIAIFRAPKGKGIRAGLCIVE